MAIVLVFTAVLSAPAFWLVYLGLTKARSQAPDEM